MNTKHTRVVVSLLLAVATLATMGFSAAPDDHPAVAIMPDHVTCQPVDPSLAAIERLDRVDGSCYPALIDAVEAEIGKGVGSAASTQSLLESIAERSRPTGSVEYLQLLEVQSESLVRPSARFTARSATRFEAFIDYHNPSSPWADSEQAGGAVVSSARSATRFEAFIDYHNPSSPWADSEQAGSAVVSSARSATRSEAFIDYHNPSSPEW